MHRAACVVLFLALCVNEVYSASRCFNRREIRQLSQTERNTFFGRMRVLMTSGDWDAFSSNHYNNNGRIHGTSLFYPWHRAFLAQLEEKLGVAIPYWDWTLDYSNPRYSPIFGPGFMQANSGCVNSTFLGNWRPRSSSSCLARSWTNYRYYSSSEINSAIGSSTSLSGLQSLLEGGPHGNVHMSCGGDMRTMYSPNDPLFYIHHAFIDYHWYRWQRTRSANFFQGQTTSTTAMSGVGVAQRDVFDTRTLSNKYCVTYNGVAKKRETEELSEISKKNPNDDSNDPNINKKLSSDNKVRREAEVEDLDAPLSLPQKLPPEWFEMNGISQKDADATFDFFTNEVVEINKIYYKKKSSF